MMGAALLVVCSLAIGGCALAADEGESSPGAGNRVPPFWVRPGYTVSVAAEGLDNARFLESDGRGTVFVSQPRTGSILSLRDGDGDGRYETRAEFVMAYPTVHGLCYRQGWLWFTQTGAVHKARDKDGDGVADEVVTVIPEGAVPSGGGHWWRSILVTDDALYTSIGDSGNATDQTDTERQKIWRFSLDGSDKQEFSSGIRNTEKLRLRPGTSEIWGADHGSDNYGKPLGEKAGSVQPVTDMNPPCEFNHYVQGAFYGHPFVVGRKLPRIEFQDRPDILDLASRARPPEWSFGAHWAPNGFTFLNKALFPGHRGDAFVAFHGSWNSTVPVGYCVERVLFDGATGKPYGSLTVVRTLSPDGKVLARPVDCVEEPSGTVLFSCDLTNTVYRISPDGQGAE